LDHILDAVEPQEALAAGRDVAKVRTASHMAPQAADRRRLRLKGRREANVIG
jgi:hypothetical protein